MDSPTDMRYYYHTDEWRRLRWEVVRRDHCKCVRCGSHPPFGKGLSAHHIIPRAIGGADIKENLITLCEKCHNLIEGRGLDSVAAIIGFVELEAEKNIPPEGLVIAAESEKPYIDVTAQLEIIRAKNALIDEKYRRLDEAKKNPPKVEPKPEPSTELERIRAKHALIDEKYQVLAEEGKGLSEASKKPRPRLVWKTYEDSKWPPVPTWESLKAYHEF